MTAPTPMISWTLTPTVPRPLDALQRVASNLDTTQRIVVSAAATVVNGVAQIGVTVLHGQTQLLTTVVRSYFDVLGEGSVVVTSPGAAARNLTFVMYDRIWEKQGNTMVTFA